MREGLVATLESEPDFEVIGQASNGREAVKQVLLHRPDIALLDITMGEVSGLDALRQFSAEAPEVKVIFLTMHEDTDFFFEALRSGASGYVLKGSRTGALLDAIRAVHQGGIYLSPRLAGELVNEYLVRAPQTPSHDALTAREREVLVLIAKGMTNRKIAVKLGVSVNTVKTHRLNIHHKLDLSGPTNLLSYALGQGLIHYPLPSQVE